MKPGFTLGLLSCLPKSATGELVAVVVVQRKNQVRPVSLKEHPVLRHSSQTHTRTLWPIVQDPCAYKTGSAAHAPVHNTTNLLI